MTAPDVPVPYRVTPAGEAVLREDPMPPTPTPRLARTSGPLSRTIAITPAGHAALARPRSTDLPEEPRRARTGSAR